MHRTITKLTASALAAGALIPAAAMAADIDLVGKPTLDQASAHQATVAFQTDKPLPRGKGGIIAGRVAFKGKLFTIKTSSQQDNRYLSIVRSERRLERGQRYGVRIYVDSRAAFLRTLTLR